MFAITMQHKVGITCRKYKMTSYQLSWKAKDVNCSHQTGSDWREIPSPQRVKLQTVRVPVAAEYCPLDNKA